jgi:hypothetical protein
MIEPKFRDRPDGIHKYNNQDHSVLTAMTAAEAASQGHQRQVSKTVAESEVLTGSFALKDRATWVAGLLAVIILPLSA